MKRLRSPKSAASQCRACTCSQGTHWQREHLIGARADLSPPLRLLCSAYLLASGGVNADQLSSNINTVNLAGIFEPLVPLSDTDVEVRRPPPLSAPRASSSAHLSPPHLQGYVRHTHEQAIISAIEEGRRATTADFYRNLDTKMRREWERQKEKMFDELGRNQAQAGPSNETSRRQGGQSGFERSVRPRPLPRLSPLLAQPDALAPRQAPAPPLPSASGSLQMHSKMLRYDRVIRRLNEFRKEGFAFGLVSALGEASVGSSSGDSVRVSPPLVTLLSRPETLTPRRSAACSPDDRDVAPPVPPRPGARRPQRRVPAHRPPGAPVRPGVPRRGPGAAGRGRAQEDDWRRRKGLPRGAVRPPLPLSGRARHGAVLTPPACSYCRFLAYVEKTLASRPAEANLGGVPSIQNKIRAFLNVKYQKNGKWANSALEVRPYLSAVGLSSPSR